MVLGFWIRGKAYEVIWCHHGFINPSSFDKKNVGGDFNGFVAALRQCHELSGMSKGVHELLC